jgi:hypothetical protein
MRPACFTLLVLLLPAAAWAQGISRSIFDDDWKPDAPESAATTQAASHGPPAGGPAPGARPSAAVPAAGDSTPAVPRPPAKSVGRLAVPAAAAQQEAIKLTNELFKSDVARAKTSPEKLALAKQMASVAATENDPCARYVLLKRAREVAIDAGDPTTACQLLDETARQYEIDYGTAKLALFDSLAHSVTGPKDSALFVTGMNHWMDGQVWLDHYDLARKAGDLAIQVARRADDTQLVAETRRHLKSVEETASSYALARAAMTRLGQSPKDPEVNTIAGRFYCLVKGDWDRGLPLLTRGSDPALKALADMELAPPNTPDTRQALAGAWWDFAHQKGLSTPFTAKAIERAAHWYRLALPELGGLQAALAEKRIAQATNAADARPGIFLSELTETKAQGIVRDGMWDVSKDVMTKSGRPLSVNGVRYQRGIGYNPSLSGGTSRITYALAGKYRRFSGLVAVNDSGGDFSAVLTFKVVGDGRELWRSQPYKEKKTTEPFDTDISGVDVLELVVDCDGRGQGAHVVWLDPRLESK